MAAVTDEYGVLLKLTADTAWIDVPSDLQSAVEAAADENIR